MVNDTVKVTPSMQRLFDRIGPGGLLCCESDPTQEGVSHGGYRWWLEPSGRSAPPKTAQKLAGSGLLVSNRDGLFGESISQSWRRP